MWQRTKHCKRTKKADVVMPTDASDSAHVEVVVDGCTEPRVSDKLRSLLAVLDLNGQAALQLLPETDADTMTQLRALSTDAYGTRLLEFMKAIESARAVMLRPTVYEAGAVFSRVAAEQQWRLSSPQTVFHVPTRRRLGPKVDCFCKYGLEALRAESPFLAEYFDTNHSALTSVIDGIALPAVTIDMCNIAIVASDEPRLLESEEDISPDALPRTAPLYLPADSRQPQHIVRPELLLVVASLLVPPCARHANHKWKTLVVASGARSRLHIVDKLCGELVDLGMTYAAPDLGPRRSQPYVWYISHWHGASMVAAVKSKLAAGLVVVVRTETSVPAELCLDAELRLVTVHIGSLAPPLTDDVWEADKVNVVYDALDVYRSACTSADPPLRVPFVRPVDMLPYRPVPRAAITASLFSEMLHGCILVCIAHHHTATLSDIETAYATYARRRGFLDMSISPEAILEGAAMVQTTVDDVVKFCAATKTFSNLLVLESAPRM